MEMRASFRRSNFKGFGLQRMNILGLNNVMLFLESITTRDNENATGYRAKVSRNPTMEKLQYNFLFPEISAGQAQHAKQYRKAKTISLGIDDTTQPLPDIVASSMANYAHNLSTRTGYRGYGAEQGSQELRKAIAETFHRDMGIQGAEVFVSNGAQCDISRLQMLFGSNMSAAIQDPIFPVRCPDASLVDS